MLSLSDRDDIVCHLLNAGADLFALWPRAYAHVLFLPSYPR